MKALSLHNVCKIYSNGVEALKSISLDVESGDFFALLGPNGAGKSTLIGILTSLIRKSSGAVKILGIDIDDNFDLAKQYIGVVPQEINFNIFDKVLNIIVNQAGYYGIPRKEALHRAEFFLHQLDLWDKRFEVARYLSGGMKRRLMIARSLVHHPKLLILDEPTAGVDIEIRRSMWKFLREINSQGITIILTTHYLEEAENLCRNIAIIDDGKIIENTSMHQFLGLLETESFILYLNTPISTLPNILDYQLTLLDPLMIEVVLPKSQDISTLFEKLRKQGISVSRMKNKSSRLEELFIQLTGREEENRDA